MRVQRFILFTVLLVAWRAAPAQGQWMATPYLHANFGDIEFRRGGPGVSVGYLGRRLGFELDVDRHQHFYKDKDLDYIPNACVPGVVGPCIDDNTDAWIFMGNVVAPFLTSGAANSRLYGTAGLGVIHAWIHDTGVYDSKQTNLSLNVGGGVLQWLNDWLGVRGDLRYFHSFVDNSKREGGYFKDYDFGRLSVGGTFRFKR